MGHLLNAIECAPPNCIQCLPDNSPDATAAHEHRSHTGQNKHNTQHQPYTMKESTQTALRAAAVLGVAFGLCVTGLIAADAKSNPIKEAMGKYNKAPKGTDPVCKKAGDGLATKEEIKGMLAAYTAMAAAKPPQGDEAKWKKLCAELVSATAALDKGEAGAAEKFKAAVNCKACHTDFKPAAKK